MGLCVSPLVTPDGQDVSDHLIPGINIADFKAFVEVASSFKRVLILGVWAGNVLGWDGGSRFWKPRCGQGGQHRHRHRQEGRMGRTSSGMGLSRKKELPRGLRAGSHSRDRELLGWACHQLQEGNVRGWAARIARTRQ